jgi:hypothetical protein
MDYALAALAGTRLADDMALQFTPHCIITQARELLQQSSAILRWEHLAIFSGVSLLFASQELPHQWLWRVTAEGVIAKEPSVDRNTLVAWTGY